MTQLRAPYPSCILEVESDEYSESEEESVTLHVQGYALTFPPFSAFGARLQLAGICNATGPTCASKHLIVGPLKAESAGAKCWRKGLADGLSQPLRMTLNF